MEPAYRIGLDGETPLLWGRFFRTPSDSEEDRTGYLYRAGHLELWSEQIVVAVPQAFLVPLDPEQEAALDYATRMAGQKGDPYPALVRRGGKLREMMLAFQNYLEASTNTTDWDLLVWGLASADALVQHIRNAEKVNDATERITEAQVAEIRQRWRDVTMLAERLRARENEVFGTMPRTLK